MTLDPKKGERAIVIKNNEGDWGILVARWDGMKRGIPGRRGNNYRSILEEHGGRSGRVLEMSRA